MRWVLLVIAGLALAGCQRNDLPQQRAAEDRLFGPVGMRIHPIFTQAGDWTGDEAPDGVEALVEFQDVLGDPTKAAGNVIFELFEYREARPDPRGRRLALWTTTMTSLEDQQQRWNRTSRTYTFQLAYPQIRTGRQYVLAATFQSAGGGRFFDRIVLEPQHLETDRAEPARPEPTTQPARP